MKKYSYILLLCIYAFSLFSSFRAQAQWDVCWEQSWYELYNCRVENVCEQYKSPKPVYSSEDYVRGSEAQAGQQDTSSPVLELDAAKELYRENMWNIYKCAIVQSQINALENMKNFLSWDTSGELWTTVWDQITLRINRLDLSANTIWCTLADNESVQNKLNILKETTHQACKHISYLEYLKTFYEWTSNLYSQEWDAGTWGNNFSRSLTPQEISNDINTRKNAVAEEVSQTYKVFPIAYTAYSEYENNFPIHFLLEIIRWDYMVLRQNLYETIMPVAQLWLKIINAMSN